MRGRRRRKGLSRVAWLLSRQADPMALVVRRRALVLLCRECGEIARWTPASQTPVPLEAVIGLANEHGYHIHLDD